MSTATVSKALNSPPVSVSKTVKIPRSMTLAEFRRRYSDREDGFKYEFNEGIIEKTSSKMKIKQSHIIRNLTRRFHNTISFKEGSELLAELEQITGFEKMRKPDLCFVPSEKIRSGDETISGFVIEITSPTDKLEDIKRKRREYFSAGVQVLWQIDPDDETVSVFASPTQVKICLTKDVCSAAPVIPDFQMTVEEIFAK